MKSPKLIGAAAIVASLLATPVVAQTMVNTPARCTGPFPDASCQYYAPGNPTTDRAYRHRRTAYREGYQDADVNRTQSGFWPLDTAGAVAGAAVGTAGAIATAPFRGGYENSYASYDRGGPGWYGDWNSYAARNGIVCRPGTLFKGDDGHMHPCQ
jgi:hypothetical protein